MYLLIWAQIPGPGSLLHKCHNELHYICYLSFAGYLGFTSTVPQILHGLQEADNIPQIKVHIVEAGSRGPCEDRIEGMEYESQYDAQYDDMRADIQEVEQSLRLPSWTSVACPCT